MKNSKRINIIYKLNVFERCGVLTINIRYENIEELDKSWEKLIEEVVNACLDYEECPYKVDLSLLITNDSLIQEINQEFRAIDKATDVLSFPSIFFNKPSDFDELDEDSDFYFHPDTGELLLGDIVISFERAKEQAEYYGHSLKREIAFLTAHSMFHLMGYDHEKEVEGNKMEEKQEKVLKNLGILR